MSYIVNKVRDDLKKIIADAAAMAAEKGTIAAVPSGAFNVEIPADRANGDFSTNAAMAWARELRNAPRRIADAIVAEANPDGTYFNRVEVAGPGFINFYLGDRYYADILKDIRAKGKNYGRSDYGKRPSQRRRACRHN